MIVDDMVSMRGGRTGGATVSSSIVGPNKASERLGSQQRVEGPATGEPVAGVCGCEIRLRSSSKVLGRGGSTGLNVSPWSGLRGR